MIRLNFALLVVLVICAVAVVTSQHKARKLYIELQKEETQQAALQEEWDKLQLEQSTWAMPARVEQVAREYLDMHVPQPSDVRVVFLAEGAR